MMSKWKVDKWVEECAVKPIVAFSPTAVQKDVNMSIEEIFARLLQLVQDGRLRIRWRIVCPNCFRQIEIVDNKDCVPRFVDCWQCGEIEVMEDMIYPLFVIDPEYKKEILSQKKLQKQKLCIHGGKEMCIRCAISPIR